MDDKARRLFINPNLVYTKHKVVINIHVNIQLVVRTPKYICFACKFDP